MSGHGTCGDSAVGRMTLFWRSVCAGTIQDAMILSHVTDACEVGARWVRGTHASVLTHAMSGHGAGGDGAVGRQEPRRRRHPGLHVPRHPLLPRRSTPGPASATAPRPPPPLFVVGRGG
eukprot:166454-Rhodomonas_salina.1